MGFVASHEDGWHPCLKQVTRCVIIAGDTSVEATNACHVQDAEVCPRVTGGCATGEGYDLCGPPVHAEAKAAELMRINGISGDGAVAFLFGHTYMCGPCQEALTAVGVRAHVITGEPA